MSDSTDEDWRVSKEDEDPLVRSSRREMNVVLGFWLVFALWVVLACWKLGYQGPTDPASMKLVLGMPTWVFWGIVVPWAVSMGFTIWFALCFMKDHDLSSDHPSATEEDDLVKEEAMDDE